MTQTGNPAKETVIKQRDVLVCLLLVVAALVVYTPALNSGYIWDDDAHVVNNQHLRSLNGLKKIWFEVGTTQQYYPMVYSAFWLAYHLWELDPFGYHLVNVLLHAANALLLWVVLRRLGISGSLIIAAVFALHPVHVESVAWITETKNTLSSFFYLLSMLLCIRIFGLDIASGKKHSSDITDLSEPNDEQRLWILYSISMFFFVCALFSKTVTCTMPAALVLLLWWKRGRVRLNQLLLLLPFFV